MYRLCKDGEKKGVHGEILQQWREGGGSRERLLKQFVTKAYDASESFTANKVGCAFATFEIGVGAQNVLSSKLCINGCDRVLVVFAIALQQQFVGKRANPS